MIIDKSLPLNNIIINTAGYVTQSIYDFKIKSDQTGKVVTIILNEPKESNERFDSFLIDITEYNLFEGTYSYSVNIENEVINTGRLRVIDSGREYNDIVFYDDGLSDDIIFFDDEYTNVDNGQLLIHINNKNNPHNVTKDQLNLDQVDNTSDSDKPISYLTGIALNDKVDKEDNKGLSSNDFTDEYKDKVDSLKPSIEYDDTFILSELSNKVDKDGLKQLSDENYTLDEKVKLAGLESSKFQGYYTNPITLRNQAKEGEGHYAFLDNGVGFDVGLWIYDINDNKWLRVQSASTAETPATIKEKYESNPDTNAFTNTEKSKLNTIETGATKNFSNAYLMNRANHEGDLYIAQIINLQTTLNTLQSNIDNIELIKGDDGIDGVDGKDFTYQDFTQEQLDLLKGQDGYTPIKDIDYFDGIDGNDGIDGKDFKYSDFTPAQLLELKGEDGQDGYSPIKGVDYFDGVDGNTPIKGIDYNDGVDGTNGIDGTDGTDGYTPIKGIDYFDGVDGKDGINGTNGIDGTDGIDGILKDQNTQLELKIWTGSQFQYDAIAVKDPIFIYYIRD